MENNAVAIPPERIVGRIHLIRGQKVMLDRDLAELYGVETRVLNQAVRRHILRFPDDFMFQLTKEEFENLKSQFVTSSWGGVRKAPLVLTEQGVAMLSGVLNSKQAILVNLAIIRVFVRMRELLETNAVLREKLAAMERQLGSHSRTIQDIYRLLQQHLAEPQESERGSMGFGNP